MNPVEASATSIPGPRLAGGFVVRRLEMDDAEQWWVLCVTRLARCRAGTIGADVASLVRRSPEELVVDADDGSRERGTFVAVRDSAFIGSVTVSRVSAATWSISGVHVEEGSRRAGVGAELVEAALAFTGAAATVTLWVAPWNRAAISMHVRAGFAATDRRWAPAPDDWVEMARPATRQAG